MWPFRWTKTITTTCEACAPLVKLVAAGNTCHTCDHHRLVRWCDYGYEPWIDSWCTARRRDCSDMGWTCGAHEPRGVR